MATITPDITTASDYGYIVAQWSPMVVTDTDPGAPEVLEYDVGLPVTFPLYSDCSIQVNGTWGVGGSITIKGSNDGSNYFALTDPQGNAQTKGADFIEQISEFVQYIKPEITAGDITTELTVTLLMRR